MKKFIPTFRVSVQEGKLTFYDEDYFNKYLRGMKGDFFLSLKGGDSRSENQNRYYWGVVVRLIAQELGYEGKEELNRLHIWIQEQVDHVTVMLDGSKIATGTSGLTTGEMEAYLTSVRQWASSFLGIYVPLPNEIASY